MLRKKLKKSGEAVDLTIKNKQDLEENDQNIYITSKFFEKPIWEKLREIELKLNESLKTIQYVHPVSSVYNPTEYASELHCAYLEKYVKNSTPVLFIGMNPGPWGMCQTGIPFGYIPAVRDWMQLRGEVKKPDRELAVRPVTGLLCDKSEQSGMRFWGLFQEICGESADSFFANCFVYNYCPLAFFHSSGRNITPAEIKGEAKNDLQKVCSLSMQEAINLLSPKIIISIGRYTEDRVNFLFKNKSINKDIVHKCMPHPSPRSLNNTNWNEKAKLWLEENEIMKYLQPT